jgi:hypothetical protein
VLTQELDLYLFWEQQSLTERELLPFKDSLKKGVGCALHHFKAWALMLPSCRSHRQNWPSRPHEAPTWADPSYRNAMAQLRLNSGITKHTGLDINCRYIMMALAWRPQPSTSAGLGQAGYLPPGWKARMSPLPT